jgi:cytochrome c oxidase subunit II
MITIRTSPDGRHRRAAAWLAVLVLAAAGAAAAQDGAELYTQQCAACHGASGEGVAGFPPLAGSEIVLGEPREMISIVLWGRGDMPSFADVLDDAEIAAVISHERTSFGNDAESIDEEEVAEVREEGEEADREPVDAAPADVAVDLPEDWFDLGRQAYLETCAACHQPTGEGITGAFPALAGNPFVTGPVEPVIELLLTGRAGMPAFSGLSNERLAFIISYIRNAWENEAHLVDAGMVETVREGDELDLEPVQPGERPGAGQ